MANQLCQQYGQRTFGEIRQCSQVAWLPDSFLPLCQIFKQEELISSPKIGMTPRSFPMVLSGGDRPMALSYLALCLPQLVKALIRSKWQTTVTGKSRRLQDALWFPGVGDHGGGPTRDMLEVQKRWQQSPFFRLEFSNAAQSTLRPPLTPTFPSGQMNCIWNFIAAATPLMQIRRIVVVKDCCTRQNCIFGNFGAGVAYPKSDLSGLEEGAV